MRPQPGQPRGHEMAAEDTALDKKPEPSCQKADSEMEEFICEISSVVYIHVLKARINDRISKKWG